MIGPVHKASAAAHLEVKAQVSVVENPKATDSTAFDTMPTTKTNRLPYRSETRPQKCEANSRPTINAEDRAPA